MKLIYIAGPYRSPSLVVRGHQDEWGIRCNQHEAERCAVHVLDGCPDAYPVVPHTNVPFHGHAPDERFLEGDKEILRRCDAVYCTPSWHQSAGARAEVELATDLRIPVFRDIVQLIEWCNVRVTPVPVQSAYQLEKEKRECTECGRNSTGYCSVHHPRRSLFTTLDHTCVEAVRLELTGVPCKACEVERGRFIPRFTCQSAADTE